jgi:hypothetical protein
VATTSPAPDAGAGGIIEITTTVVEAAGYRLAARPPSNPAKPKYIFRPIRVSIRGSTRRPPIQVIDMIWRRRWEFGLRRLAEN